MGMLHPTQGGPQSRRPGAALSQEVRFNEPETRIFAPEHTAYSVSVCLWRALLVLIFNLKGRLERFGNAYRTQTRLSGAKRYVYIYLR